MGTRHQQGFALLLVMLVVVITGTAIFLAFHGTGASARSETERTRAQALADAREAVLAYALAGGTGGTDRPGALPCPDHNGDGQSQGSACPSDVVSLGRLPHRTLDIPAPEHGLWFVITPELLNDGSVVNPDVIDDVGLTINGVDGYAAAIIAPGPPLQGQALRGSDQETPADYLEAGNDDDSSSEFVDCRGVDGCNDHVMGIGIDELFANVQRRLLGDVEFALLEFFADHGHFPRPATFASDDRVCNPETLLGRLPTVEPEPPGPPGPPNGEPPGNEHCEAHEYIATELLPDWIMVNNWIPSGDEESERVDFIVYHVAESCTVEAPAGTECGDSGLSLGAVEGLGAVVIAGGRELPGQDRRAATAGLGDYLESPNDEPDGAYIDARTRNNLRNDAFRGVAPP